MIGANIGDVDSSTCRHNATCDRAVIGRWRVLCQPFDVVSFYVIGGHQTKRAVLPSVDHGEIGIAEFCCGRNDRIEHWLQLIGRSANDVENFGGCGLLLQGSRSSLSRRVFSMAITAWAAKLVTSSICLSVKGRTSRR